MKCPHGMPRLEKRTLKIENKVVEGRSMTGSDGKLGRRKERYSL